MGNEEKKAKIISSLLWSLMQRSGVQGIQLIITLILARILLPEDFGLVVIVTIFNTLAIIIVQSGFTTGLIQKKDIDHLDLSSIFYINVLSSIIMYVLLFNLAPFIAAFFNQPQLVLILRIISMSLFLSSFHSIQYVIVSRNLQFKDLFLASFLAHILSGSIGIVMAYSNFGVWALVVQQLTSYLLNPIFLYFKVRWRPQLTFSFSRVTSLFSYGWKLLVSSLINNLYSNLHSIIIGKIFNPAMIGFYNRGDQFPNIIVSNVNGSIQSVMLPTLSSYQDNPPRVKDMVRRTIVTSSFVIFPMMVGLIVIAEPLVKLVLTDKWLPTVPFLQIFCMVYAFWPLQTTNLQAINALGRSDIFLRLEILNTLFGIVVLIITFQFGIYAMTFGLFISSIFASIIDSYPNSKLLDYSILEQFRDITPSMLISIVMGAVIYPISLLEMSSLTTLLTQIFLGIIIYLGLARAFKIECFNYLLTTLYGMLGNSRWGEKLTLYNREVK